MNSLNMQVFFYRLVDNIDDISSGDFFSSIYIILRTSKEIESIKKKKDNFFFNNASEVNLGIQYYFDRHT